MYTRNNRNRYRVPRTTKGVMTAAAVGTLSKSYREYYGKSGNAKVEAKRIVKGAEHAKAVRKAVRKVSKKKMPYQKLQKQVHDLSRKSKDALGTLVYRVTDGAVQISNNNTAGNETFTLNSTTEIETVLGQLRYYNPSSPATLVTADFTTGSYSKDVNIKYSKLELTIRNNYQTPCIVRAWRLSVKSDNNINPETAWSNGLTDISNGSLNDIHMYPTDSPQFTDLWKIDKERIIYLNPGQERTVKVYTSNIHYDPSVVDSQTDPNQRSCKTKAIMCNVAGVIAHDTVAAQYGTIGCGVDFLVKKTYIVEYNAGANIKYIYLSNNLDAMTTSAVVSNMPISDNQAYSVA